MNTYSVPHHPGRQAFSLVESAIVLGVIGLVIGGIWVAASEFMLRHKINTSVVLVRTVVREMDKYFTNPQTQLTASQYLDSFLIAAGSIPQDMVRDANYMTHPFGGQFRVRAGIAPVNYFRVVFYQTPKYACVALVNSIVSGISQERPTTDDAYGLNTLVVGGSSSIDFPGQLKQAGTLISEIAPYCQSSETVTVTFYYRIPYNR